jgi:hypothetical protein
MTLFFHGSSQRRWAAPRLALRLALLLTVTASLAVCAPAARAQDGEGVYYSPKRTFLIPFTTDPNDKRIKSVILHVSEDQGRTYTVATSANPPGPAARPEEKAFRFTATKDGWHWFVVQTQEFNGDLHPPKLDTVQPGIKVCVDTEPPQVTLSPATQPRDGTVGVVWNIVDDNLKLLSLRLEYRASPRNDWIDIPIQKLAQSEHDWNPGTSSDIEVRLTVQDKAGNETVKTTRVTPGAATSSGGAQPPVTGATKPATPPSDGPPRGKVLMVNKHRIQLNTRIADFGPSGVSTVEVWYTFDAMKWTLYKSYQIEKPSKDGPIDQSFTVEMGGEGRYGFTIIAKSGVGFSDNPPAKGDEPQIWVEVDETLPKVQIISVEVGRGPDTGTMKILWSAQDRFLADKPITILYAASENGVPASEWKPIAPNIPNDGKYIWKMPEGLPFKVHIRVEAVDQATNVGRDETKQAIPVDLKVPKAVITSAEPAGK